MPRVVNTERKADPLPELPAPSAEMVLIRVFVQSYLATAHVKPRLRARAFLDAAARSLADEESIATLLPIRPARDHAAVAEARKQAIGIFRQLMPAFVAKLPSE